MQYKGRREEDLWLHHVGIVFYMYRPAVGHQQQAGTSLSFSCRRGRCFCCHGKIYPIHNKCSDATYCTGWAKNRRKGPKLLECMKIRASSAFYGYLAAIKLSQFVCAVMNQVRTEPNFAYSRREFEYRRPDAAVAPLLLLRLQDPVLEPVGGVFAAVSVRGGVDAPLEPDPGGRRVGLDLAADLHRVTAAGAVKLLLVRVAVGLV